MATSLSGLAVSDSRLEEICSVANDWSLCHGVSFRSGGEGAEAKKAVCAPYSLFPSVVPAPVLHQAKSTMVHFSRLMHKVAMDHEFLEKSLKSVIEVDQFMLNLWNIYLKVRENGVKQPLHLGLFRNDFMMATVDKYSPGDLLGADRLELKQIEFNCIASSFAGTTGQLTHLHRLTLGMTGKRFTSDQLPDNSPATGLADGMVKAWTLYGKPQAVIVFIVNSVERNAMDQRFMEFPIYARNPTIRVLRRTLLDFYTSGTLGDDSTLFIDNDEVAVLYLRDGYTGENYPTQKEWDARMKMEMSCAIKCPSIQYQLTGSKKIQQELSRPGSVERFVHDTDIVSALRATFVHQYSLDLTTEGDAAVELALASPDKYVLKPQREGGGNNLYNNDITEFFTQHRNSKERSAYILMERIFPWQQKNLLVKSGFPFLLSDVVSELGVYGVYLGSASTEVENFECGHMMRTKMHGTDEGGIAAGFAVLDTPFVM